MLAGCTKLNEEDYVIKNIEELYPNAKCVGIEDGLTERNLEKRHIILITGILNLNSVII